VTTTPSSGPSPASATAPPAAVGVIADCVTAPHWLSTQPAAIVLACADDGFGLENMTWTSWTKAGAVGQGAFRENLCQPSCAAGSTVTYPVAVRLSAVKASSIGPWFSLVTFTWKVGRPPSPPDNPLLLPAPAP
jgi:hypothetical protein